MRAPSAEKSASMTRIAPFSSMSTTLKILAELVIYPDMPQTDKRELTSREKGYYDGLDQPVTIEEWVCGISVILFLLAVFIGAPALIITLFFIGTNEVPCV